MWSTQEAAGLGPRVARAPVATPPQMPPSLPDAPFQPAAAGGPFSPLPPPSQPGQWASEWQRDAPTMPNMPEVVVLSCIEVELPSLLDGQVGAAYRADFAGDVARHFGQAARMIPQVRETRGWMRGDRLVLAARAVVGMGNRGATRAEGEWMLDLLREALSQRTLPYTHLGFADPAEWIHGAPLPE